jgi:hypothetical protein
MPRNAASVLCVAAPLSFPATWEVAAGTTIQPVLDMATHGVSPTSTQTVTWPN